MIKFKDDLKTKLKEFNIKDINVKELWSDLQEDSPGIAKAVKVLLFIIAILVVIRLCSSPTPVVTEVTQVTQDSTSTSPTNYDQVATKKELHKEEIEADLTTIEEYSFSWIQDTKLTKEQLDYLVKKYKNKYTVSQIRMAYFAAQDKWFKDHLLNERDGIVNFENYVE